MAEDFRFPKDQYILIGKVGKPHGLRGELKIVCFSEQPENVASYKNLYLVDRAGRISSGLQIVNCRVQGKAAIVEVESIKSRSSAEQVIGSGILVARSELPEIAENEFYYFQFQGKQVVTEDGKHIGLVHQIFNNGAQDILVVVSGKEEMLIPVTKNIVTRVTEESLIIDLPPGLLEINKL